MSQFNASFWEIPADARYLDNLPAEKALWFETQQDQERRQALRDFFAAVLPAVEKLIDSELTSRQQQVLKLYYYGCKSQEDIAAQLALSQSTVSRHLFGTVRNGRKVGGAIPKLRKAVDRTSNRTITAALSSLRARFARGLP